MASPTARKFRLRPASPAAKLGRGWKSSDQTRCPTPRCIRYAGHWLSSGRQFRGCLRQPSYSRLCLASMSRRASSPTGLQCRSRIYSGRARSGDACRPEVAAGVECFCQARSCLGHGAGRGTGAWRYREAIARRCGCRRRAPDRRIGAAGSVHAHRGIRSLSKLAPASKLMRWCVAAKRSRRSRRREHAPSLDVPRNWFGPRTLKVPSRGPCCAWCVIWPW